MANHLLAAKWGKVGGKWQTLEVGLVIWFGLGEGAVFENAEHQFADQ